MQKNIFVMSNKGGTGKTTVAVNLAFLLSKKYSVGLLDADIHGPNAPKMLGMERQKLAVVNNKIIPAKVGNNLYVMSVDFLSENQSQPIVWRGPLKTKLINQFISDVEWPNLNFLVVDLPPGTGDETITIMQLLKENSKAIIVSTPQEVSLMDVEKIVNMAREFKIPIAGLIENMSGDIFGKGNVKKFADEQKVRFLGEIGLSKIIANSSNSGHPFVLEESTNSYKQFNNIVQKII
ncbi:MAG: P-loop NTPase [Xanthomonadaceae bacterium]|nr:P-loop NTPase [Rhodospirillaceae bacterium]NIA18052.1 P-loop NTPase [Xanthomonadaceae bacterium]